MDGALVRSNNELLAPARSTGDVVDAVTAGQHRTEDRQRLRPAAKARSLAHAAVIVIARYAASVLSSAGW